MPAKSLKEWEEELHKVVPDLDDLLNHYDFGIRVLRHLDEPQQLLQIILEEYERHLEALGNTPLVPEEGEEVLEEEKKRLRALLMFATYAAEAKSLAEINEQRRRQNEELRCLNSRLQKILDTAPVGILVLSSDGRVEEINKVAAELFGRRPEEVRGRPYGEVLGGLSEVFASEEEGAREVAVQCDGRSSVFLVNLGMLRGEGGKVVVITDLTSQRRLEQEKVRLEAVTQTVRALNHEINNPLAIICGKVELLLMRGKLSEEVREDLEAVERAARRISYIVSKLTKVTRVTTTELVEGFPMVDVERSTAEGDGG